MGAGASAQSSECCVEVESQGSKSYDYFVEPLRSASVGGGDGGGFVISTLPETVILRVAPEAIVLMDGTNVGGANLKEHVPPKPIQHHPYHTIMCWGHSRSTFQFRITVATEVPLPAGHSSGGGDEGGGSRSGVGGSGTDGPGHDAGRGAPPAKADGKDSPSAAGGAEGAEAGGGGAGGEQAAADAVGSSSSSSSSSSSGGGGGGSGSSGSSSSSSSGGGGGGSSSGCARRCVVATEEHTLRFRTKRGKEIEDRTLAVVKGLMAEMQKKALTDAEFGALLTALKARVSEAAAVAVANPAEMGGEAAAAAADGFGFGGGGGFGGAADEGDGGLVGLVRGWAPTKAFIARQGVELLRWFRARTSVFECIDAVCALHGRLMTPGSFQLLLNEFPSRGDRDNVCHRLGIKDPGSSGLDLNCPDGLERATNHAAIKAHRGGGKGGGKDGGGGGGGKDGFDERPEAERRSAEDVAEAEERLAVVVSGARREAAITFCSSGLGLSLEARVFKVKGRADSSIEVVTVDSFVEGLPADEARARGEMQTGDVLVAVNGTSVVGLPLRNVTALFKQGTEGTETTLTLLRPTDRLS